VRDLWKRRHLVPHEAKSEFFHETHVDEAFQIYIPRLDYLNRAVTFFAVDNLSVANTISELWKRVEDWRIPEDIVMAPPHTAATIAATKILLDFHVSWPGVGITLDAELARDE
jgi:hypothetical protein